MARGGFSRHNERVRISTITLPNERRLTRTTRLDANLVINIFRHSTRAPMHGFGTPFYSDTRIAKFSLHIPTGFGPDLFRIPFVLHTMAGLVGGGGGGVDLERGGWLAIQNTWLATVQKDIVHPSGREDNSIFHRQQDMFCCLEANDWDVPTLCEVRLTGRLLACIPVSERSETRFLSRRTSLRVSVSVSVSVSVLCAWARMHACCGESEPGWRVQAWTSLGDWRADWTDEARRRQDGAGVTDVVRVVYYVYTLIFVHTCSS